MKLEDMLYHPKLVKISYKIYEISAALGFAVMPPPPKEYYIQQLVKKNLKNLDKIRENIKALGIDYEKIIDNEQRRVTNNPKDS